MKEIKIKAIIGLGNPGREYEDTYHNAGIMLCEYLLDRFPARELEETASFVANIIDINGTEVFVIRVKSFMNISGEAVSRAMRRFNLQADNTALAHDDSDFELGRYRFSFGSTSAGHKGVDSVINSLGTKDFLRIRIGIRKSAGKALDFVLEKIPKADKESLKKVFDEISERLVREFI